MIGSEIAIFIFPFIMNSLRMKFGGSVPGGATSTGGSGSGIIMIGSPIVRLRSNLTGIMYNPSKYSVNKIVMG